MAKFICSRRTKSSDPDIDNWEQILYDVDGVEVLSYLPGGKILVSHDDEAQLRVSAGSVCEISRKL